MVAKSNTPVTVALSVGDTLREAIAQPTSTISTQLNSKLNCALFCGVVTKALKGELITMAAKGTSFFRVAGLSYLQYVNKSAIVLREALKEPLKSKVAGRNKVEFAAFKWADGERGKRGM